MNTKSVVEGLLYQHSNNDLLRDQLERVGILNRFDRDWGPKEHLGLFYLSSFQEYSILAISDKLLSVYLIGKVEKASQYHVIRIMGTYCEHMLIKKRALREMIRRQSMNEYKLYLPNRRLQRIIYLKGEKQFVFNRLAYTGNLFGKSTWSVGTDIYTQHEKQFETDAHQILNAIFSEF